MKRFNSPLMVAITAVTTAISLNSCIYEAPGDKFYRTLWNSSQIPLGPLDIEELTLEFLCGDKVTIKDGSGIIIAHGTYDPDGNVAVFGDLIAVIDETTVSFVEAHRDGDTLFLLWRPDEMMYPFTTAMQRLSGYE